ncbi:hypothetical protein [Deinococcus multiflagellatus]|uniref:Tetratricopeptide repeat protein n=1 Tax=Deinococcus multiflagellatus TaxID=1656887 RepID=A0ABW1ZRT3_9DEIO|nr:hypothetical protein [Deinococcus multiflagellatus]MBZ9715592.1 hypothetical protein [Deinococcus multiflagellatus]
MRRTFALMALILGAAHAATLPDAERDLAQGDWQSAARIATAVGGADGFNLAAKAYVLGASITDTPHELLGKALVAARTALKLAPDNAMAHFQLAQALGRQAQGANLLSGAKLASQVKAALLAAIQLDPRLPQPYAALAVWHAEISARGRLPALLLGASQNEALKYFEQAIRLDPLTMSYHVEYGRALLNMPEPGLRARGIQHLQQALTLAPRTFWEREEQRKARQLLASHQ